MQYDSDGWIGQVREVARRFLHGLEELVEPNCCPVCWTRLYCPREEARFCDSCLSRSFEPTLRRLGLYRVEPLPRDILFRTAVWEVRGRDPLLGYLHRMKYGQDRELAIHFGRVLGEQLLLESDRSGLKRRFDPCLVPVPLHKDRLKERGYNQSRLVAIGVAKVTGWPVVDPGSVVRVRQTSSQTRLERPERQANLAGAFQVASLDLLPWECPVLIDDLWTTGATLLELARVLRREGVFRMALATVAEVG